MAKKPTLRDQLDQLQLDYGEQTKEFDGLLDVIERSHNQEHAEVFRYCQHPVCKLAGELEYAPESRVIL